MSFTLEAAVGSGQQKGGPGCYGIELYPPFIPLWRDAMLGSGAAQGNSVHSRAPPCEVG